MTTSRTIFLFALIGFNLVMDPEQLGNFGQIVVASVLPDDLSRDRNLVEDVPHEDADDDIVLQVENDALAVVFGFVVRWRGGRRGHHFDARLGFRFPQSFVRFRDSSPDNKIIRHIIADYLMALAVISTTLDDCQ